MKFLQIASLVAFASAYTAAEDKLRDLCHENKDFMLKNRKLCN
jgi:hypothetical protein